MNNANEWRLWVLKGSVAAAFLRLKGNFGLRAIVSGR